MIRKRPGQTFTEYGLVGALIVVVAVPAVVLLSGNVQDIVFNILPSPGNRGADDDLFVHGERPRDGADHTVDGTHQIIIPDPADDLEVIYDQDTGTYTVPVIEGNGGGTTTASVDDAQALYAAYQEFEKLSEMDNLPPELKDDLKALAHHARGMHTIENGDDTNQNGPSGEPACSGCGKSSVGGMSLRINQFANKLAQFKAKLAKGKFGRFQHIARVVEAHSAMMSHHLHQAGQMDGQSNHFADLGRTVRQG